MHMDEGEIIREYRSAKNRREQVQILADLNGVDRMEMAIWLSEHGEAVDKRLLPKSEAKDAPQGDHDTADDKETTGETEQAGEASQEAGEISGPCGEVVRPAANCGMEPIQKTKVYIAGAITDNPDYEVQFAMVEGWLAGLGFAPVNPAKNQEDSYKAYVDTGLKQLSECSLICMIPGWKDFSDGAALEKKYADTVGIPEILIPEKVWEKIEEGIVR